MILLNDYIIIICSPSTGFLSFCMSSLLCFKLILGLKFSHRQKAGTGHGGWGGGTRVLLHFSYILCHSPRELSAGRHFKCVAVLFCKEKIQIHNTRELMI